MIVHYFRVAFLGLSLLPVCVSVMALVPALAFVLAPAFADIHRIIAVISAVDFARTRPHAVCSQMESVRFCRKVQMAAPCVRLSGLRVRSLHAIHSFQSALLPFNDRRAFSTPRRRSPSFAPSHPAATSWTHSPSSPIPPIPCGLPTGPRRSIPARPCPDFAAFRCLLPVFRTGPPQLPSTPASLMHWPSREQEAVFGVGKSWCCRQRLLARAFIWGL